MANLRVTVPEHPAMTTVVPRTLADVYADRHERLDEFIVMYAVPRAILARIGVEFLSVRGRLLLFAFLFLSILLPAVVVAAVTGALADWLPLRAVAVSGSLALLNVFAFVVAQASAFKISALHRTLIDDDEIRRLAAWDRRWYSPMASAVFGGAIGLAFLAVLFVVHRDLTGVDLTPTAVWIAAVVTTFLGQYSFSTAMIFAEFLQFTRCHFRLYPLSPIDTRAVRTTSTGLKELGVISVTLFPLFYLVLLSVLPQVSQLIVLVTGGFLLLGYLAIAIGILFPLRFIGTIVKAEKWRVLEPIEARLTGMVARFHTLSDAEHEEFSRLAELHRRVAESKDSLLGLGAVARIAGAAALSTVTVVVTAIIESYVARTA
jgi:hypothetical protein